MSDSGQSTREQDREQQIAAVGKIFRELGRMVEAYEVFVGSTSQIVDIERLQDSYLVSIYREVVHDSMATLADLLCSGMLHLLFELTVPQRLVWCLRGEIASRGGDPAQVAVDVRHGTVVSVAPVPCILVPGNGCTVLQWTLHQGISAHV